MVEGQDLRGNLEVGVVVDESEGVFGGKHGGELIGDADPAVSIAAR
jgi:hypothetical protein